MAQVNKNTLKEYFQTGSIPNQQNFSDLIDSFVNIQDDSSTVKAMYESNNNTNNFTDAEKNSLSDLNSGATLSNDDAKFATQKQAKDAISLSIFKPKIAYRFQTQTLMQIILLSLLLTMLYPQLAELFFLMR